MVSHVDDDHIQGILDLTKEMVDAHVDGKPLLLKICSVWHNTFDDIIGTTKPEIDCRVPKPIRGGSGRRRVLANATIEAVNDATK